MYVQQNLRKQNPALNRKFHVPENTIELYETICWDENMSKMRFYSVCCDSILVGFTIIHVGIQYPHVFKYR